MLAREQLLEVRVCDLVEVEVELAASCATYQSTSPSSFASAAAAPASLAAVVADRLLGMLGHLARLPGQAQGRVGEPASRGYTAVRREGDWYSDSSTPAILDATRPTGARDAEFAEIASGPGRSNRPRGGR